MQPITTKPRILYVDEDADASFMLATLLRLANFDPVTTNFASDALQFARSDEFDLYLLSRRFPIGSGTYLCQKLYEISPQTPIIFLSDEGSALVQNEGFRSGSEEHVMRSRDAREVLDAVRRVLSMRTSVTAIAKPPSVAGFAPNFS